MSTQAPTQTRAAICRGNTAPFTIEDVTLDDLRPDELRVRIVACGVKEDLQGTTT